jgi:hypothetical protein
MVGVGGPNDSIIDGYLEYLNEWWNVMTGHHFLEAFRRRPPAFRAAGPIFADLISFRFRS